MPYLSATPSAAKVVTTENYVSTVDYLSAIHKPDVNEVFVKRYGDQGITGLMAMLGNKRPVANKEFIHFEEDWIHQTITIDTDADTKAITGGYQIQITISGYTASADHSPIKLNHIIEFENGQVGLVVALSVDGAAFESVPGYTPAAPATPANGLVFAQVLTYDGTATDVANIPGVAIVTGTEFAEGTDQPDGMTPNVIKYSNTVMIIKESYEVTGSEATNATWMKIVDPGTGKSGWLWYLKGEGDTYRKFDDYMELQMLNGEKVAAGATALAGLGMRGTEGLIDFAEGGNDIGFTTSFGVSDFRTVVVALDKNRGAMENTAWAGLTTSLDVDDNFRDHFGGGTNNGGASFGTFEGGAEKAVQMGFKSFQYGGYTFHKKSYKAFNHTKLLGYTDSGSADSVYRTAMLLVPGDSQVDPISRESVPSLSIRYKEADGYSRELEHWLTGSAVLKNKTNGEDKLKCNYRTERGFEGFANNRYAWVTKN
jgi:hypothetical protein